MRIVSQQEFLKTPAGVDAQRELRLMINSPAYDTTGALGPLTSDGLTFMERHLNYLVKHPYVAPSAYISNLRTMTRVGR